MNDRSPPRIVGRYALYDELAAGGMATVHYGRLLGPVGFARTVAIKRLHPQFAKDPEFAAMFLDEARLAARIRHPYVVPTLDVVAQDGELFLVMDYVQGESLARLSRALRSRGEAVPLGIASAILCATLHGLHAAHEATNDRGEPLHIVHRDVSPQNILVGADGVPRVLDFGIAKAAGRMHQTREGEIKGKLAYMAPEQLLGGPVDRRTDVFAAGVVLWETLTRRRLFAAENEGAVVTGVLTTPIEPPSALVDGLPKAVDEVCARALQRTAKDRFATAREMALALEAAAPPATTATVAAWVEGIAGVEITTRARVVANIESESDSGRVVVPPTAEARPPRRSDAPTEVGAASRVTSMTASADAAPARGAPARRKLLLATSAVGVLAVGATFALGAGRAAPPPGPVPRSATAAAEPGTAPLAATSGSAPSREGPTAATTGGGAGGSSSTSPTAPVASSTPAAGPSTPAAPPRRPPPASAPRRAPVPPAPTAAGSRCDPPYYFDPQGNRVFKKECL